MYTKIVFRSVLILVSALLFVLPAMSQNASEAAPPVTFSEVMYHKLLPGHTLDEALAIEKEWKKIHQVQIDNKRIVGWYVLTKALSSNPDQGEYDFITIKTFVDLGHEDNSYPDKDLEKAFGPTFKAKWSDLTRRTSTVKSGVKVEIWRNSDGVYSNKPISPIWQVDFMQVKNGLNADYVALETTFKGLHQERIAMGNIDGWTFSQLMYPSGSEKGYQYATVNYYPSMKEMSDPHYGEAIQKVMPNADIPKIMADVYRTRDIVRQEIYILREYVATAPVQAMK